jgi:protoporphyrinogen/coproporphyrinogen III oxidase
MLDDGRNSLRVAVVGGGVSGIAAAEELGRRGHTAEIFEAGERLGGRIAPAVLRSREIYLGGKNLGHRYRRLRELLARRGEPRYEAFGPESAHVAGGRVRELSFRSPSMRARLGARLLLRGQVRGGLRFLRLAQGVGRNPDSACLGDRGFAELARRSGDPTLPEYLGSAICEGVVRHMTVRMNGAEPEECHIGNLGSNLGLVVDRFDQLAGAGLGDWIRAVEAANLVHPRKPVVRLLGGGEGIRGVVAGDGEEHRFDGVVLAIPAHEAARAIGDSDEDLARLLCTVRYFPVGVVVAEYDRPAFPAAFAALTAPAGMALSNAGSYGLRDRHIVRYTFSGRNARDRVRPDAFDPEALLAEAEAFLGRHAPVAGARRLGFAARAFQPGLCAYRRDHDAFLHEAGLHLASLPGLELAGDYMRGASLEACVRAGQEAVEQLLASDRQEARR